MKNPKLIFIPGWGTNSSIFKAVRDKLKMQSICIEWWNCLSDNVNSNALYLELESAIDPVVIVGWSLSGMIALSAVIKYQKKISSLFLISTTPRMIGDEDYCGVNEHIIKAMIRKLKRNPVETLEDFFTLCTDVQETQNIASLQTIRSNKKNSYIFDLLNTAIKIKKEHLLAGLLYLKNSDLRNELGKVNIPVRIIHGQKDRVINIKNGIYLSKNLPLAEIKILKDSEHLFFHKNPSFLVNELSNFINKTVSVD